VGGGELVLTIWSQAGLPHYLVVDAGHTQIAAGSRTVLGIGPGMIYTQYLKWNRFFH
jgi:PTH2 family peptidyl-tRNA hydrolase